MASKKDHKTEAIPKGVRVDAMCSLHKGNQLELFCVDDTELCCGICERKSLHKNHKVVELSELVEDNEMFSAAKVRERFEGALKCDDDLEKRIAETIENVQKKKVRMQKRRFHSPSERHTRS